MFLVYSTKSIPLKITFLEQPMDRLEASAELDLSSHWPRPKLWSNSSRSPLKAGLKSGKSRRYGRTAAGAMVGRQPELWSQDSAPAGCRFCVRCVYLWHVCGGRRYRSAPAVSRSEGVALARANRRAVCVPVRRPGRTRTLTAADASNWSTIDVIGHVTGARNKHWGARAVSRRPRRGRSSHPLQLRWTRREVREGGEGRAGRGLRSRYKRERWLAVLTAQP